MKRKLTVSWWTVLDEEENEVRRALSSQLLGFVLAESTQASQHPTAVRHAFPFFIFNLDANISPPGPADRVGKSCRISMLPPGCVCSLWMTLTQEGLLFFCKASGVCMCVCVCLRLCQM